jgi:hypothetical protein
MRQPPGFEDKHVPHHICKLDKAIYGLKQTPHAWYSKLSAKLISLGFSVSKADSSLFFISYNSCTMFVLVYVDDIIVASSSLKLTNTLVQKLNQEFALKDMGDLHYFLGIQVKRSQEGVLMTQEGYARDILRPVNMFQCRPVSTPMTPGDKLSITDGEALGPKDATQYRSVVGPLQ